MAAGKTSVGRALAERTSRHFVDLDDGLDTSLVALGERSYPITVGPEFAVEIPPRSAVVTDSNVAKHWLPELGFDGPVVLVSPGEASKSIITYQRVCEELVGHGLDRGSTILALGGGVVGDLAGFVAATLSRGVAVALVPATLG